MTYATEEERQAGRIRSQKKYYINVIRPRNEKNKQEILNGKTPDERMEIKKEKMRSYYWNVLKPKNDAAKKVYQQDNLMTQIGRPRSSRNIDKGQKIKTLQINKGTFVIDFS